MDLFMKANYGLIFVALSFVLSCRPLSTVRTEPESDPQGLVSKGIASKLFPPLPKNKESMGKIGKAMLRSGDVPSSMKSPIGQFRGTLFSVLISSGGVPRNQIREILEQILSSKSGSCSGVPCSRIFGFTSDDIERQLDDALSAVQNSPRLAQADMADKKNILLRSLEKRPEWLNPDDFGAPLTPRKTYDLKSEIATFNSCHDCSISADEEVIRSMIASARKGDHFVWALRPDGRLVVGRGPDEKMSHGVLASIDLIDIRNTKNETLSVFASGEGYVDPVQKLLILNNKSGHYRPEFKRVDNSSIRRVFGALLPSSTSGIKFVDQTKPR